MNAIQEQVRLSIEVCIHEHLDQDVDRDNAIVEASREIAAALCRPIAKGGRDSFSVLLDRIEATLMVPAAEYVPAIGDVFKIIDEARGKREQGRT